MKVQIRRVIRVARQLAKDPRVPLWLKVMWIAGLAPIPGPIDELWLPVPALVTWMLYGDVVRDLWQNAA